MALPTSGPAWDAMRAYALDDWGKIDLDDTSSKHDLHTLAAAFYGVRIGDDERIQEVREVLERLVDEDPSFVLGMARNLIGYVIAADVIGYQSTALDVWLSNVLRKDADGRAGIFSLLNSARTDPSNHGTHARASVLATAIYLNDRVLVDEMAERFHDWLGRSGDGFVWKSPGWQADRENPRGIGPVGASIEGLSVDGILPEEQRRSGKFTTEPKKESYVWEALQGVVATAEILDRSGYPAWEWEDQAILRSYRWLHDVNDYPATGDDVWQVYLVNKAYGTSFPLSSPTVPGKNLGYTDWTVQLGVPG